MTYFGKFFSYAGGWRAKRATIIPDGDNQARTSEFDGQTFVLGRGDATWVDGKPVLTFADDRVTFKNKGEASTTGDTATVDIQGDRGTVKNFHGARITAEDTGVEVSGRDALIHNRGTIDGGVNGVNFVNGGESSGVLRNYGTVSSDSRAVNIGGEDIQINNYGRILGTGDQRNGTIYADATADDYSVNNFRSGVVDAGKGNDGAGIALQLGSEVDASIYNSGVIQGRGQAAPDTGLAGDGIRLFSGVAGDSTFDGNITNNGKILSESDQGPTAALRVANGVGFDGTITNGRHGVIDGANNGLYFGTGEHDATVNNYGLIQSDSRAVNIDGSGVDLNNYGRILGDGDQRNGTIYADATANDYSINNFRYGVVDAGKGNDGAGIALQLGSDVDADIYNSGVIQGRGQAAPDTGLAGDGIRLFSGVAGASTFDGNITNNGRILSESDQGPTAALRVANGVGFDGTITNGRHGVIDGANNGLYFGTGEHDATVNNYGLIQSDSRAVNIDGSGVDLNNYGRILGDGDQRNGTVYSDATAEDFSITNYRYGLIDAGHGNRGAGISLQIGDEKGDVVEADVVNYGTVRGRGEESGDNLTGDGIRLFSGISEGSTIYKGDVANHGTITADDDGIDLNDGVTFAGDIDNRGRINAGDDGIDFDSGVTFLGTLSNSGSVYAAENAISIAEDVRFESEDLYQIVNTGLLKGDYGIDAEFADGDLGIRNEGRIIGDVKLGSGNDLFNGEGGTVAGDIDSGAGSDFIVSGDFGNRINGGDGDDTLEGGSGKDTFVFERGTDRDTVLEFQLDRDRLDVSDFGFGSVDEFLEDADEIDGNTIITLDIEEDAVDQIILVGVALNDLDANEFVIA